jgi:DNA-binding beta-propeller fold protein YncE
MSVSSIRLIARRQRWMGLAVLLGSLALSACGGGATAQVKPTATPAPIVRVAATIHLAAPAGASHPVANGLWFTGPNQQTLYEIDPATNAVVAALPAPVGMGEFLFTAGSLWIGFDGRIERLDTGSGRVLAAIPLDGLRAGGARMAADATSLWVGNSYGNSLARIDLATNRLVKVVPIDALPVAVAVADGSVWVCAHHSFYAQPALWRIDPTTYQTVAKIDTTESGQGFQCDDVQADANGAIWAANGQELRNQWNLLRIDPAANRITAEAAIDDNFTGIVVDPNNVWVLDSDRGTVVRYDARRVQLIGMSAPLSVGGPSNSEVAGLIWEAAGSIWVQSFTSATQGDTGPTVWRLSITE